MSSLIDAQHSTVPTIEKITRRNFIKISAAAVAALGMSNPVLAAFKFIPEIDNPLDFYPDRDWEKIYRDQFKYDSTVHFLCAPNDTHNCLLRGYVKNDIITRIGPSYGYGKAKDVYGNQASHRWDPRLCQKGLVMVRKIYGPRRVKYPMIREGFKNWVDAGFPRDENGRMPERYLNRGKESFIRVTFEEACEIVAKSAVNIATTYSGKTGENLLKKQGYDESMIEEMQGAGTQTLKLRGGMAFLGATRIFGMYRFANSLALLDDKIRKVGKEKALGGRGFDSYSWHTDLPPGHTMTCGHQTMDFDLSTVENSNLVICWGMNWISTKMPDAHWLTEARLKGTKVVTVACEYQSTSNKADNVIVIRPGSDTAFALGLTNIIISENLYDTDFVRGHTDMPLLVRMDTLKLLKPQDIIVDYQPSELKKTTILKQGENALPNTEQDRQITTEKLRNEWGDFIAWNSDTNQTEIVTRDDAATIKNFALEGEFTVDALDGKKISVRPVFDMLKEHASYFTPEVVSDLCSVNQDAITWLAREIAKNKSKTLVPVGMGPNHFYNGDLSGRAIFLVCALTKNIGFHGGNIGSFSGNYRGAYFNGLPYYIAEDPFDIELDPAKTPRHKDYYKYESAHYLNYGDRPLRAGDKLFTGKSHMPTPTKFFWFNNGNSILGNLKWHHDFVMNTLPKIECVVVNEWWWTASCEYADVVFAIDSWAELKYPDMTAAVTNPFLSIFPRTSLKKVHDTRSDIEVLAGVGKAMAKVTEDARFDDYWKFVNEQNVEVYLQRIIDHSSTLKGYKIEELEANAIEGIPALIMLRTYPKAMGWEQSVDNKPHYTKSGRMEFYRDEDEFIEYGENIPIHREPIDSTIYEPNVIVCGGTNLIRPKSPEKYGLSRDDLSCEVRQVRNVIIQPAQVTKTVHPLRKNGFSLVYITPKYRHGAHTTPVDIDLMSLWFGPFGDISRRDKRMPWVGEGYVDLNPVDAKELGIADGDYVYIDADPDDRPFRGWQNKPDDHRVHRAMMRARYYMGIPRGIARSWHNMFVATYGSVEGHETNPDKLARNPRTGYQAMFRYGSHQSATRAWLKPTLMTDSMARKDYFGQKIGKGFAADVYCTVGAPKEAFVKATKAEQGGVEHALWRPAELGFRPGYEGEAIKKFLKGGFSL
ncbi:MAG: molybdopterin-dependent oxidoreductase [Candidatus Methanoperedens sp.]|uniref:molybdopterin-dependent oxidoreductase n=1 Tax=Candidatus Methanoperedens sp. BLZ2 TaxID=2035255 RepID=UPI000BE3934F|nr:molybdopterin-dependent oxidoreductase [Candidatus Methanoperedens sp. BLZ2]KAB2946918.1 MAG: molybdopterin-dependent oxidoreductase [Candidatus Methanoperedens sp.]MBZ0176714.1 molybdopterin-dependent oxidoreductase [Candidatus Methanoperedens nitroreducens]MCX9080436.1 molybdopterin-dependent oxidoreductase [Candidatus Methanoperedens sp.]